MRDFTTSTYSRFLELLVERYIPSTVSEYISCNKKSTSGKCVLRHDVDRIPHNALRLAEIEADYNVKATYYFRMKSCSYDAEIAQRIEGLGHEIGYHYETLSDARGNYEKAWVLFKENLQKLRQNHSITSVSMHGSPLSKHNNIDLLAKFNYKGLGLIGDATLDINWENSVYFCDTGRSWDNRHNRRDYTPGSLARREKPPQHILRIPEYCKTIGKNAVISTHPERWAKNGAEFYRYLLKDSSINMAKLLSNLPLNIKNRRK